MAVSFSQYTNEATRRRSMAYSQENATTEIPMPEHFHQPQQQQHTYQHPDFQATYYPPPPPPQPSIQYQPQYPHPHQSQQLQPQPQPQPYNYFAQQPPAYYEKPPQPAIQEELPPPPPPRPPKTLLDDHSPALPPRPSSTLLTPTTSHSPTHSITASSSFSSAIEPDPLPPHSNPQTLTQTQSLAFSNSAPIPPVRLGHEEIYNAQNGYADYIIVRSSPSTLTSLLSSSNSNKPHLTITSTANGSPIGYIRFHNFTSSAIDVSLRGRETSISHSVISNKWSFLSTTAGNGEERWYWKSDKSTGGAKLEDKKGKGGHTLARMKGDLLSFEQGRLGKDSYEEVMMSAVAMAEAARRCKRGADVGDLAKAIGDFTAGGGHGTA